MPINVTVIELDPDDPNAIDVSVEEDIHSNRVDIVNLTIQAESGHTVRFNGSPPVIRDTILLALHLLQQHDEDQLDLIRERELAEGEQEWLDEQYADEMRAARMHDFPNDPFYG